MFGRDAKLPLDILLPEEDREPAGDSQHWITKHQTSLREAYTTASERLKDAASTRKKMHDQRGRALAEPLRVGERVLLRNHKVRGRNKIQDKWEDKVYKIIERRDNNTYVIDRADGQGGEKVVSQTELQVCPRPLLELHQHYRPAIRRRQGCAAPQESSDEEDDYGEFTIAFQPTNEPATDHDDSDDTSEEEPETPVLRRSTRTTAGQHSNRYNLPRSALQH